MTVAKLVLCWRDQSARCFTAWHFLPAPREQARVRAQKIITAAQALSQLQIYGAVLDTSLLHLVAIKPAPADGTDTRLEVKVQPNTKGQVGGGQLRFSIPGPLPALAPLVAAQQFAAPLWRLIEQELIPYLCSPAGVKASVAPAHIVRAEIAHLDAEHRPQPGQPPFQDALQRTEEALTAAKARYQLTQTPKVFQRREKYQDRLALLQKWQDLEQECFERIDLLPATAISVAEAELITARAVPALEPLPAFDKEVIMPALQEFLPISEQTLFLPMPPSPEAANDWTDVPQAHFQTSQMWLHRLQLRQLYGLNERTYYRWINQLKNYGLTRYLPAQGNERVTLFYRPDVNRAVELAEADTARRRHRATAATAASSSISRPAAVATAADAAATAAATTAPANAAVTTPATAAPDIAALTAQLAHVSRQLANLSAQQHALTTALAQLEANFSQLRQADLELAQQQFLRLTQQQAELANQLPQARLVDLLAQLVNIQHLPSLLKRLNAQVSSLANPNAKAAKHPNPAKTAKRANHAKRAKRANHAKRAKRAKPKAAQGKAAQGKAAQAAKPKAAKAEKPVMAKAEKGKAAKKRTTSKRKTKRSLR